MSDNKHLISGLVIAYNEEKNIAELIENMDFVDELIIVDSFSKDNTVPIINSFENVTLVQHAFENFTAQRNFALSLAKHSWVLFMDADERITPKLKQEILDTVQKEDACSAYYFYRQFMFNDKPLHFSGCQTDKNFRLFQKDKAHYISERLVHETLQVDGSIGILKNKLIHYTYNDYETYKKKMISYGKLRAQELYNQGRYPNFYHRYIKPAYRFLLNYIIRLGILDGKKGIIVCYLNALTVHERYKELSKMRKND